MSSQYLVPDTESTADLLKAIFGEDLAVKDDGSSALSDRHVATYVGEDNQIVAICACDPAFVAYSGAAFSMVPAKTAKDMVKDGQISTDILANFREIMNICSRLFMSDSTAHLKLDKTLPPDQSAEALSSMNDATAKTRNFGVTIPGYGDGAMTFLVS